MNAKKSLWPGLAVATLLAGAGIALAGGPGGHPPHHRPPPAAYDACKGKSAGDTCEVALRDRKITGQCVADDASQLFCRPDHPPGPPPEAIEACKGRNEGDSCKVTFGGETHDGRCVNGPQGMACRPDHPPHCPPPPER